MFYNHKQALMGGRQTQEKGGQRRLFLLVLLLFCLPASLACAEVKDPFEGAGQSWVTLQDYDGKVAAQRPKTEEEVRKLLAPTSQAVPASVAPQDPNTVPSQVATAPEEPKARPQIRAPLMPRLAVTSDVTVSSTAVVEPEPVPVREEPKPQVAVSPPQPEPQHKQREPAQEQAAIEPAVLSAQEATLTDARDDVAIPSVSTQGIPVRFAVLPGDRVRSIPASAVSLGKKDREAKAARDEAKAAKAKAKEEPLAEIKPKERDAACEAFAAYRLKQLEAIKNDQETLLKLKSVLAELGLTKRLSFMTNADGSLEPNVQGEQTKTP